MHLIQLKTNIFLTSLIWSIISTIDFVPYLDLYSREKKNALVQLQSNFLLKNFN